jgi:hypothetical protein
MISDIIDSENSSSSDVLIDDNSHIPNMPVGKSASIDPTER